MSARTREYVQKPWAPGDVQLWTDWDGTEHIGTVWSDAPKAGMRWMLEDDGAVALLKVGMSGRSKGEVFVDEQHPAGWQRQIVRALDLLCRSNVWTSTREVPFDPPIGNGTYAQTRVHVDPDCAAEHDDRGRWTAGYYNWAMGSSGWAQVRYALKSAEDPYREVTQLVAKLCPKCTATAAAVAA